MRQVLGVCTCVLLVAGTAHGQDRFEIQVYDSETAPAGSPGVELHLNHVLAGTTESSPEGELPTQHLTHLTLEPHLGLAGWAEVGAYLQAALSSDGTFRYGGVKLRFKARLPWKLEDLVGLAINFEFSDVPQVFEANRLGSEIRPIADIHWKRLYAAINPIVGIDLAGPLAGRPQLEPAARLAVDVASGLMAGVEYYSGLGALGAGPSASTHLLFAAVDFTSDFFDVNAGVGYGLAGEERWVVKAIIGFHPPPPDSLR